jgi:hypothetical protein
MLLLQALLKASLLPSKVSSSLLLLLRLLLIQGVSS